MCTDDFLIGLNNKQLLSVFVLQLKILHSHSNSIKKINQKIKLKNFINLNKSYLHE